MKGSRGLPSIARARDDRAEGRVRWTTRAGVVGLAAVVASFIAYKVVGARDLNSGKQALFAKQRAVAATLGSEWYPLRDKLEREVLAASTDYRVTRSSGSPDRSPPEGEKSGKNSRKVGYQARLVKDTFPSGQTAHRVSPSSGRCRPPAKP